jgi:hypothetical protein
LLLLSREGFFMNRYRSRLMLLIVAGLFTLSGSNCQTWPRTQQPALPPVLPPNASLEQVIEAVNRNNGQIQSFTANQASLSSPGAPTLRAVIAFQRPLSFRLHATYGLTGAELDLGSNDTLFWFWIRRSDPPAVYFCRHDQFATSPARQMVPIQPDWLIDALGVSTFDPALPHQGPYPLPNGRLEVRTIKETPEGSITKRTILDASQGWVLGQEIYNAQSVLLVSTEATNHRRDPRTGLWIPGTVKVKCPSAQFEMQLDLGTVEINVPPANPAETFSMPTFQGTPAVDIGNPNFRPPGCPPVTPGVR